MGSSSIINNNNSSIFYNFEEKEHYENKIINVDDFMNEMELSYSSMTNSSDGDSDDSVLELEYSTCYNVKGLSQIMDYYKLNKKNMRKDEMIQLIILFETDIKNSTIVNRRRRLWSHINELKRDKYFSKFILFTMV